MASAREIRRRIKSVKNIAQVTRALQAVSASKARRAQEVQLELFGERFANGDAAHAVPARIEWWREHADAELPGLIADLKNGLANFSTLTATANNLLRTADKALPPMSRDLQQLLTSINGTAMALTKTLHNIDQITAKDSTLSYQVASSLQEIEKAAASIRQLTDYLQQNPNALVFGQGEDKP